MGKKIVFTTAVLCLLSCISSVKQQREISLYNQNAFILYPQEVIVDNNTQIVERFQELLEADSVVQVPLYKFLEALDYSIYIGMIYDRESISSIMHFDFIRPEEKENQKFITDTTSFIYSTYRRQDSSFISKYIIDVQENLFCILTQTTHQNIQDSLFTLEALKQRIRWKNK